METNGDKTMSKEAAKKLSALIQMTDAKADAKLIQFAVKDLAETLAADKNFTGELYDALKEGA